MEAIKRARFLALQVAIEKPPAVTEQEKNKVEVNGVNQKSCSIHYIRNVFIPFYLPPPPPIENINRVGAPC